MANFKSQPNLFPEIYRKVYRIFHLAKFAFALFLERAAPLLLCRKLLGRVLCGVTTLRPTNPDNRVAFLFPHHKFPSAITRALFKDLPLFKAAVVFGFFGMFRYSSYAKLSAISIVLVTPSGRGLKNRKPR